MSPEQVSGQKVDGRSDIFALGAVFYEMLVGRPPFVGDDINAVFYQVLHGAPPLPSSFIPELPHGFDRIVARALAKSPDKRYQSATEMAAALRKYRRIARIAQKEQLEASTTRLTSGPGDATVLITKAPEAARPVAPPRRARTLGYAIPLLVVAVIGGWLAFGSLQPTSKASPQVASVQPAEVQPVPLPAQFEAPSAGAVAPAPDAVAAEASPDAKATEARPVGVGRIRLAIAPWGEVYVDGKAAGVSPPLREIRLTAGQHKIEIRNGKFAPHRQTVDLAGDESLRIKHKFE
jgi:serine/threonine-protein kinase